MHNFDYSIVCCFYNEIQILKKKFDEFLKEIKNSPFSYEVLIVIIILTMGRMNF